MRSRAHYHSMSHAAQRLFLQGAIFQGASQNVYMVAGQVGTLIIFVALWK